MNIVIRFASKPVSELREGNMIRTGEASATRVMGIERHAGVATIDRFHGGPIQLGEHQSVEVMV